MIGSSVRYLFLIIFLLSVPAGSLFAEIDTGERNSPTMFLRVDASFTTFKSEMVESNDTGFSFGYTLGFHAGSERNIGILLVTDQTTIDFALNNASITSSWQDTIIRYRMGGFYLGGVIGRVAMEVTPGDDTVVDETLDIIGSGYGGNTGFTLGFGRNNAWFTDVTFVTISEAREAAQADVSFGSRMDIDTGVVFYMTRHAFDLVMGYKMRTYTMDVGSSYAESQNFTYLGFKLNSFF